MCQKHDDLNKQILHYRSKLSKTCPAILVQSICTKIQEVNSKVFSNHLHLIKTQKLQQLIGPAPQMIPRPELIPKLDRK